jgi:hypothetical protein
MFLEAFPQDLPFSLPSGSEVGKIPPVALSLFVLKKKKKRQYKENS